MSSPSKKTKVVKKTRGAAPKFVIDEKKPSGDGAVEKLRPGVGWFTRAELANIFEVSLSQVDRHYALIAGPSARRAVGQNKTFYHARSIINALINEAEGLPASNSPGDDLAKKSTADDGGENSPALERRRLALAKIAEHDLALRLREVVPLVDIEPPLLRLCELIRRAAENIAIKHGPDVAVPLHDALDQWELQLASMLEKPADPDNPTPDPA